MQFFDTGSTTFFMSLKYTVTDFKMPISFVIHWSCSSIFYPEFLIPNNNGEYGEADVLYIL